MAPFIRLTHSQDFAQSAKQGGFSPPYFPCLQVDTAPKILIGSLEEIENGARNYVMVDASDSRGRRLAVAYFPMAPWHVGIGYTETAIIHGLFALFARHVPAANDASLCAPRIRRRFSDRRSCCAERHSDAEYYNGQHGR
jgi:hypothetical protein